LEEVLARFQPITLEEMDRVKLQTRVDTKYMFAGTDLLELLVKLLPEYRLLEVEGERGTRYRSLYFDTADLAHFRDHHNGRVFRSKVRLREYVRTGQCFLEVKRKTGRGDTDKVRMKAPSITQTLTDEQSAFVVQASNNPEALGPVLWNHFTRLTFVHDVRHERLTIDREIRFSSADNSRELVGICVAELKEERADRGSPFARLMRERVIAPSGMSKYCIGMLMLGLAPKHNTFKETLLRMERLRRAA
jgi:hypothetical protein